MISVGAKTIAKLAVEVAGIKRRGTTVFSAIAISNDTPNTFATNKT